MSAKPTTHSLRQMTGWRAAAVWLVTASGIVAIGFAELFNPADWIIVLMFVTVIVSFGMVGAVVVVRLPGNLVGWLLWGSGVALVWAFPNDFKVGGILLAGAHPRGNGLRVGGRADHLEGAAEPRRLVHAPGRLLLGLRPSSRSSTPGSRSSRPAPPGRALRRVAQHMGLATRDSDAPDPDAHLLP